jgi:hypothetical protein
MNYEPKNKLNKKTTTNSPTGLRLLTVEASPKVAGSAHIINDGKVRTNPEPNFAHHSSPKWRVNFKKLFLDVMYREKSRV